MKHGIDKQWLVTAAVVVVLALTTVGAYILIRWDRYREEAGPLAILSDDDWTEHSYPSTDVADAKVTYSFRLPPVWTLMDEQSNGIVRFTSNNNRLVLAVARFGDDTDATAQFHKDPERYLRRTVPEFFTPEARQTFALDNDPVAPGRYIVRAYLDHEFSQTTVHFLRDGSYYTATAAVSAQGNASNNCGSLDVTACEDLLVTALHSVTVSGNALE